MRELRLVAVSEDGTSLVLTGLGEPAGGEEQRFRLSIDERLRAAVQLDRLRLGQLEIKVESSLRPREIQARIRAGEPAENVARDAGVPVEHIRRFEGPVLREREHMAEEARRARVRRGEADVGALGELVDERLRAQGVADDAVRWDSWRLDDGSWTVEVTYRSDGGDPVRGRWRFDPLRRAVRPLGPPAAELVGEPADNVRTFAPREGPSAANPAAANPTVAPQHPTGRDEPSAAAVAEPATEETAALAAAGGGPAAGGGAATGAGRGPARGRERRGEGEASRRRASVPSWDEIMFGAKPPQ
jgi:hypothetical protein